MTSVTSNEAAQGKERRPAAAGQNNNTEKYLTFMLGKEEYGVDILRAREIIGTMEITPVPQTPEFVKGVINLRGKIIPVVDLRIKFGMPPRDYDDKTCIIVVEVPGESERVLVGVVVDQVQEVTPIMDEDIEPPSSIGAAVQSKYIHGLAKTKDGVKILLNIEHVLSSEELMLVQKESGTA